MPKISEFYGISILNKGEFIDKAPKILRKLINIWYNEHREELLKAWELMQTKKEVLYIEPLH